MRKQNRRIMQRIIASLLIILLVVSPVDRVLATEGEVTATESVRNSTQNSTQDDVRNSTQDSTQDDAQNSIQASASANTAGTVQAGMTQDTEAVSGTAQDTEDASVLTMDDIVEKYENYEDVINSDEYKELMEARAEEHADRPIGNHVIPSDFEADEIEDSDIPAAMFSDEAGMAAGALPRTYTLEDNPHLTPIRNQGSWGTCWAFSAMAMAESAYDRLTGEEIDLSEKQLVQFFYNNSNIDLEGPDGGLSGDYNANLSETKVQQGGNTIFTTFALANWKGAADEALDKSLEYDVQYTRNHKYVNDLEIDREFAYDDTLHMQNAYWINRNNQEDIKRAIYEYGIVGVSYRADHSGTYTSEYTKGYCEDKNNPYVQYCPIASNTNHAVAIVGWDDDFDLHYFENTGDNYTRKCSGERMLLPENNGAWLIRNSWGSTFGNDGYFWLSYEDKTISDTIFALDFELADNYDHNYQYDGASGNRYVYGTSVTGAAVFQPNGDEQIKAIGIGVASTTTDAKIQIYTNLQNDSKPDSGTLVSTTSTKIKYQGFHTVELTTPVAVKEGEKYGVVVTLTNGKLKGGSYSAFFSDKTYQNGTWVAFHADTSLGQTYMKVNSTWRDMAEQSTPCTLRIKSYTDDEGWSCRVDDTELFVNDESQNTAELTIDNALTTARYTYSITKNLPKTKDTYVISLTPAQDTHSASILALAEGNAEITVQDAKGRTEKIAITVSKRPEPDSISVNYVKLDCTNTEDNDFVLKYRFSPTDSFCSGVLKNFRVTLSGSNVVKAGEPELGEGAVEVPITILGPGVETVTATLNRDEKVIPLVATTVVNVKKGFSDEDIRKIEQGAGKLYALTNTATTLLGSIELPEYYSWTKPDTKLAASNKEPIQYFEAAYQEENSEKVIVELPVHVTKVSGVSVAGPAVLGAGEKCELKAKLSYAGYNQYENEADFITKQKLPSDKISYEWTSSNASVSLNSVAETVQVNGISAGAAKVSLKVRGLSAAPLQTTISMKVLDKYIKDISVEPQAGTLEYVSENGIIKVDYKVVSPSSNVITLKAKTEQGDVSDKKTIKWSVSDTSVATIAMQADGTGKVTVKSPGVTEIYATANDSYKRTETLKLIVADKTPKLMNSEITVYCGYNNKAPLYIAEQSGNVVKGIKANDSDELAFDKAENVWALRYTGSTTKNIVIKTTLTAQTQEAEKEEESYEIGTLTVKVIANPPKLTFKNLKKANLFYSSDSDSGENHAIYQLSADQPIRKVSSNVVPSGFECESYQNGQLCLKPAGLTKATLSNYPKSITLYVTYEDGNLFAYKINVATMTKAPSYEIKEIAPLVNDTEAVMHVYDKSTKEEITFDSSWSAQPNAKSSMKQLEFKVVPVNSAESAESVQTQLLVRGFDTRKAGNYKVDITSNYFTKSITLSGKIAKGTDKLTTKLAKTSVVWNMEKCCEENGKFAIPVSFKNSDRKPAAVMEPEGKNKNSTELLEKGYVVITQRKASSKASPKIYIGLTKDGAENAKPGKYQFVIRAKADNGTVMNPQVLTFQLVNKKMALSVGKKGSINLADRANSGITITPKVVNDTAMIKSVKLTGEHAAYFAIKDIQSQEGNVTSCRIVAKSGMQMNTKRNYQVRLCATLDSGKMVESGVIKIKPACKYPKINATVSKSRMYKNSEAAVDFKVYTVNGAAIEQVELENSKYSEYFKLEVLPRGANDPQDVVSVRITLTGNRAALKSGSYALKYRVTMKEGATNVIPAAKTIKITL